MSKDLVDLFIKESSHQAYQHGYDQAMKDAILTIKNLLQHNDIRMHTKEFWAEYKNLKDEGKIK